MKLSALFLTLFFLSINCFSQIKEATKPIQPVPDCCGFPNDPSINFHPASQTICAGSNVSFTASADPADGHSWEMSTDNGLTWVSSIGNSTTSANNIDMLIISAVTTQMNGYLLRCYYSGSCCGKAITTAATLTVATVPLQINLQPVNIATCKNNSADFMMTVSGSSLSYQWQESTNGGTIFLDIPGKTTSLLHFDSAKLNMNNNQYRCIIKSECGATVISNPSTLTVIDNSTVITIQPSNQRVCEGDTVFFTTSVSGNAVNYQWQEYHGFGGYYNDIIGATSASLAIPYPATTYYRCKITSTCNTIFTNQVTSSYITAPIFAAEEKYLCSGEQALFSSIPYYEGTDYKFQWQVNTDSGFNFTDISEANSNNLSIPVTALVNGYRYRCHTSSNCFDGFSNVHILYAVIIPTSIENQPQDKNGCAGFPINFSVKVTGKVSAYQWQVSTDNGINFTDLNSGGYNFNVAEMTLNRIDVSQNYYQYRCKITSNCVPAIYSNAAILKVYPNPSLSADTTLSVTCDTCTKDITLVYDTTNFASIWWSTVHPANASAGKYKLKVFNKAGCSDSAFIYINVNRADTIKICKGGSVSFSSSISGASYQWQMDYGLGFSDVLNTLPGYSDFVITGATSKTLKITGTQGLQINGQVRCLVNNSTYSNVSIFKIVAYWNGSVSNAWEDPLNWSCGEIPDRNTEVYIMKNALRLPEINTNAECKKLILYNNSTITIKSGNHLDVTGPQ